MKIAVPYDHGMIFQHFGHTETFCIYTAEDGKVVSREMLDTNGSGHGALAALLGQEKVDILICGGIGGGARNALSEVGIEIYGGIFDIADVAVDNLLQGTLKYDPNAHCDHHDHHHGEGHTCGDHGCGEHDCHH